MKPHKWDINCSSHFLACLIWSLVLCWRVLVDHLQWTMRLSFADRSLSKLSKSVPLHRYSPESVRLTDFSVKRPPSPLMSLFWKRTYTLLLVGESGIDDLIIVRATLECNYNQQKNSIVSYLHTSLLKSNKGWGFPSVSHFISTLSPSLIGGVLSKVKVVFSGGSAGTRKNEENIKISSEVGVTACVSLGKREFLSLPQRKEKKRFPDTTFLIHRCFSLALKYISSAVRMIKSFL